METDTVTLILTTRCSRKCRHCAFPWDYTWDSDEKHIAWLARVVGKVHRVEITGGEPTEHPRFAELVPSLLKLKEDVEAERLTIVTGRYHPLLTKFTTVFVSEYDDNAEDVRKIKGENEDVVSGVPRHLPADSSTHEGKRCHRAEIGVVSVLKNRMYPCCGAPAYDKAPSLLLYPGIDWRAGIAKTPFYCAHCRFSGTG